MIPLGLLLPLVAAAAWLLFLVAVPTQVATVALAAIAYGCGFLHARECRS